MAEGLPSENIDKINRELELYSPQLCLKPQVVVATKMDIADEERLNNLRRYCKIKELELIEISAVTGEGLRELVIRTAEKLKELQ